MTIEENVPPELSRKPSHPVWRATKIIVGMGFMALGFVGLFLPVLQGVLFLLVGLAILSTEIPRVRRIRDEIQRRYPGPWRQAQALKDRMKGWFGRSDRHDKETTGDEGASGSAP